MGLSLTVIPVWNGTKAAAADLLRSWNLNKKSSPQIKALLPGNFIHTKYAAVTPGVYDVNPVVMIIRANRKYVFGININWLHPLEKKKLMDFLIKNKIETKSRLAIIPVIRKLRLFRFTRKAYRLYHRKELAKPRLFELNAVEFYTALMRNIRKERMVTK